MTQRISSLIILTFKEGVRDRALFGIGLFSLLLMGASLVVVSLFMRELNKVAVDINLSAITFAGLMLTFFVSINLLSKDMDKHTIYCVLSKPISRSEYIFGKFLGIMLLIISAFAILTIFSSITIVIIKYQYATWFKSFAWLGFYKAIYSEILMFAVINAIVIFFSTITTSSFITLLFSISTYIAGQTIEEVVLFLKTQPEIMLTDTIKTIIDICQYILPNLAVFDLKTQASHGLAVSGSYISAITLYSFTYSIIVLIFSSIIFSKRELV